MSNPKKKAFTLCANIAALMVAMCVGVVGHALWLERKSSQGSVDNGGCQMESLFSSNHLVRVSVPWGRSKFDYSDDAYEQETLDEEFMETLFTACGFEYTPSYEMGERRCFIVKGLESCVLVSDGIIQCKGWAENLIPDNREETAKEVVAKLNADAPSSIRFCIDGDLLWCESTLPVEVLRRTATLDEQKETLRLLSSIPNEAIKRYKPELDKILSRD